MKTSARLLSAILIMALVLCFASGRALIAGATDGVPENGAVTENAGGEDNGNTEVPGNTPAPENTPENTPEDTPEDAPENGGETEQYSLSLDPASLSFDEIGAVKTIAVTAKVNGEAAEAPSITWRSSDENVATVENGAVTSVAAGSAVITAAWDKGPSATCEVTVSENSDKLREGDGPTGELPTMEDTGAILVLSPTEYTFTDLDQSLQITAKAYYYEDDWPNPSIVTEIDYEDLEFLSGDESVCTVDVNGVVTPVGNGDTVIYAGCTVDPEYNDWGDDERADVSADNPTVIHVQLAVKNIELELEDPAPLWVGGSSVNLSDLISYTITPAAAEDNANLVWSVDKTSIAAVEDGKLVPKGRGTVTVTLKDTVSGKSSSVQVKVDQFYCSSTSPSPAKYTKGSKKTLTFTFKCDYDNDNTFQYYKDAGQNVYVDGKKIDSKYYTATPGSVKVTLNSDYLEDKSVKAGKHKIKTDFKVGSQTLTSTEGEFTVVANTSGGEAKTGDSSLIGLNLIVFLASLAYIAFDLFSRYRAITVNAPAAAAALSASETITTSSVESFESEESDDSEEKSE